ncbi:MAG: hypothetical protein WC408_05645 [Candidatus Micrarchaeia archaeon]|jgi:hypothetical protein
MKEKQDDSKKSSSQKTTHGKQNNEKLMNAAKWAAAFVVLFIICVYAFQVLGIGKMRTSMIDGMRMESEANIEPKAGLAIILSQDPQIVRMETFNGSDSRNSMVAIIASEAIRSIANANKSVTSYAVVYDPADSKKFPDFIGCNENNSQCGNATILVRFGTCNCMKVLASQKLLIIEGDSSFATIHINKVGGIIGLIEAEIANQTAK